MKQHTRVIPDGYAKRVKAFIAGMVVADSEVEMALGGASTALAVDRPEAVALALALVFELTRDVEAWVLVAQMVDISTKAGLWDPEFNELLRERWKAAAA